MEEKKSLDVQNIIPVINFIMELGNVIEKVVKTKNFASFFDLMDELIAFQAVDWSRVIPELKDISQDEKEQLKKVAFDKFDIENDRIEFIIEEGLSIILSAGYLVERCMALNKRPLMIKGLLLFTAFASSSKALIDAAP